jgi:hypothetical protein
MKLKHYVSDYAKHKRAHSAALRLNAVYPLKGDGPSARRSNYHNRYAKRPVNGRVALVEARYADWMAARDAAQGLAS